MQLPIILRNTCCWQICVSDANGLLTNTELNDMRLLIHVRKTFVSVERISVCNVPEKNGRACSSYIGYHSK